MSYNPEKALWQEVLLRQITDAISGPANVSKKERASIIRDTRHYLTTPSKSLNTVCTMAGIEAAAVIERMREQIANAPTPEQLVKPKKQIKPAERLLTYDGKTMTVAQWSEHLGIPETAIVTRLNHRWSTRRALCTPFRKRGANSKEPGVGFDFERLEGTGGGRSAQDTPKITFSDGEAS